MKVPKTVRVALLTEENLEVVSGREDIEQYGEQTNNKSLSITRIAVHEAFDSGSVNIEVCDACRLFRSEADNDRFPYGEFDIAVLLSDCKPPTLLLLLRHSSDSTSFRRRHPFRLPGD